MATHFPIHMGYSPSHGNPLKSPQSTPLKKKKVREEGQNLHVSGLMQGGRCSQPKKRQPTRLKWSTERSTTSTQLA